MACRVDHEKGVGWRKSLTRKKDRREDRVQSLYKGMRCCGEGARERETFRVRRGKI